MYVGAKGRSFDGLVHFAVTPERITDQQQQRMASGLAIGIISLHDAVDVLAVRKIADKDEIRPAVGKPLPGLFLFLCVQGFVGRVSSIMGHGDLFGAHAIGLGDVVRRVLRNSDDVFGNPGKTREMAPVIIAVGPGEILGAVFEIDVVDHRHLGDPGAKAQEAIGRKEKVGPDTPQFAGNAQVEIPAVKQGMTRGRKYDPGLHIFCVEELFVKRPVENECEFPVGLQAHHPRQHFVAEPSDAIEFAGNEQACIDREMHGRKDAQSTIIMSGYKRVAGYLPQLFSSLAGTLRIFDPCAFGMAVVAVSLFVTSAYGGVYLVANAIIGVFGGFTPVATGEDKTQANDPTNAKYMSYLPHISLIGRNSQLQREA